ncbi:NifU family protein [Amycolatopsis sp. NPDC005961]|uniref:NifU family protein n=1 Tax=Amycolatopsis sp. NPDC005961 TaxID=3156720 RepID=UPI0033EE8D90
MTPAAGARLGTLLATLLAGEHRRSAEELVRQLTDLYGDGLTRVVAALREHAPDLLDAIAADDVVTDLLVLHDLHPLDVAERVRLALERVGGDAGYLGLDGGVARVWLGGGCSGVPQAVVEAAVRDAAPEVTGVEFVTAFYQIGVGPPAGRAS